jgi:hypothetical protein
MAGSKANVRVDNQYTSTFPITNGVRQEDALSSVLFDLVLVAIFQKMNIDDHIGTKSTQILAMIFSIQQQWYEYVQKCTGGL